MVCIPPAEMDTLTTEALKELTGAMENLFIDGKYTDLTVSCQDDTYRVHKAIICNQCSFFAKACDGGFKEANTNEINLVEDESCAVQAMFQFLYTCTYSDKVSFVEGADLVCEMSLHIKVYALADKYDIPGLKAHALDRFDKQVKAEFPKEIPSFSKFKHAVQEIYTTTPHTDRDLRDIVVALAAQYSKELFGSEVGFAKMMDDVGEFGKDLSEYMSSKWVITGDLTPKKYTCPECTRIFVTQMVAGRNWCSGCGEAKTEENWAPYAAN
ncbi:hypothetical protein EJ08DRAFT_385400 [Tothia fuscella]|uniref:BTB domain-containing protein n=1 Tax=Tothia fuscella TaxID=1048955 RepID=A0A9P4P0D8_9PEZI|nr:hypothetical protein EJ08DRAFT_385400 [Tothia fuscella]